MDLSIIDSIKMFANKVWHVTSNIATSLAEESVADEATGGAFPLRVAVKGVTVDISALETD